MTTLEGLNLENPGELLEHGTANSTQVQISD
jgi:hypothetical protein